MRTDPRKACDNPEESWFWAIVHDVFAHALLGLTFYSRPAVWFHNWTSIRAWPLAKRPAPPFVGEPDWTIALPHIGDGTAKVVIRHIAPNIWEVSHPRVNHKMRTNAANREEALHKCVKWFVSLSKEFGGEFEMFV